MKSAMNLKCILITMQKVTLILYRHFCKEANIGYFYPDIQESERRTRMALGVDRQSFQRWIHDDGCTEAAVKQEGKTKLMILTRIPLDV
jgi:hypothetical protein